MDNTRNTTMRDAFIGLTLIAGLVGAAFVEKAENRSSYKKGFKDASSTADIYYRKSLNGEPFNKEYEKTKLFSAAMVARRL